MNLADEMAAKIATIKRQSAGPGSDPDDMLRELDQRLRASLKDLQRTGNRSKPVEDLRSNNKLNEQPEDFPHTNHQAKPAEDLHPGDKLNEQPEHFPHTHHQAKPLEDLHSHDELNEQTEDFPRRNHQARPVEDLPSLVPRISDHLDDETSDRIRAVRSQPKRRASRRFSRYLFAICMGVAGTLAWQSYGEATKQIVAANAPSLGWSPEAKQMIADWVQQLGWTKPSTGPENTAVQLPAPKMPQAAPLTQAGSETARSGSTTLVVPSLDQQQVQQMESDIAAVQQSVEQRLAAVRATVEQLAVGQDQVLREIAKLHQEIANKIAASPPRRPVAVPAHQPTAQAPPSSPTPAPPSSQTPAPLQ
ncbi:MAG: hypothetical protein WAK55_01470, partial [Xanthobacteraceae bacterium]